MSRTRRTKFVALVSAVASAAALCGLRLSYSALTPPALERGVRLLTEAWRGIMGGTRAAESVVY